MKFPAIFRKREDPVTPTRKEVEKLLIYRIQTGKALLTVCDSVSRLLTRLEELMLDPRNTPEYLIRVLKELKEWKREDATHLPLPNPPAKLTPMLKVPDGEFSIGEYAAAHLAAYPKHPHPQWKRYYYMVETKKERRCRVPFTLSVIYPITEAGQEWSGTYHTQQQSIAWDDDTARPPVRDASLERFFCAEGEADYMSDNVFICMRDYNPKVTSVGSCGLHSILTYVKHDDGFYRLREIACPASYPCNPYMGTEFHDLATQAETIRKEIEATQDLLRTLPGKYIRNDEQ